MTENKSNIALLLGDPAGIGPELISKLLNDEMTKKANIVIIGEKQVFESGNNITGISHNIDINIPMAISMHAMQNEVFL